MKLRIVSVYFATAQKEHGRKKIYMQQKLALLELNKKESVYEAFWQDFWDSVNKWKENSEQLVICGDWNVDIRKQSFRSQFFHHQLIPSNIQRHGINGPGTYSRGSKPIDEIFISNTLQLQACGYLAYGDAAGDHRPIWIEISKVNAFGSKLHQALSPKARRLKCLDPRIVRNYTQVMLEELRKKKVFSRLYKLYQEFQTPLTLTQQQAMWTN